MEAKYAPRREDATVGGSKLLLSFFQYWDVPKSPMAPPPNPMWLWTESCAFKAASGVLIGGGLGVAMGLFFGVLSADPSVTFGPGGRMVPQPPLGEQVVSAWRGLGSKAVWYMKSFAVITGRQIPLRWTTATTNSPAALFSGLDCLFEKSRGKHDVLNSGLSACATGAILAVKQGPSAAGFGCAGFAAFSVAIDTIVHQAER